MAIVVRDGQRLKRPIVATSAEQAELRELRVARRRRQSQIAFGSVDFPHQIRSPGQASAIVERGDRAALDYDEGRRTSGKNADSKKKPRPPIFVLLTRLNHLRDFL